MKNTDCRAGNGEVQAANTARQKNADAEERNLVFDGKGVELLVACLKWLLFYIVTIGIYCLWIPVKYRAWVVEHTHNK